MAQICLTWHNLKGETVIYEFLPAMELWEVQIPSQEEGAVLIGMVRMQEVGCAFTSVHSACKEGKHIELESQRS